MIKGIILLGGPSNRVNFGSDLPAPLIPIAGLEMVAHQIYALSRIPNLKEVLLYGYYDEGAIKNLIAEKSHQTGLYIHYVVEQSERGTAGQLALDAEKIFQDATRENVIVLHSDICSDFPLREFYEFHEQNNNPCSMMTVRIKNQDARQYGNFIMDAQTKELLHHAEKPVNYISDQINCGIYIFNRKFEEIFLTALQDKSNVIISYQIIQENKQYQRKLTIFVLKKQYFQLRELIQQSHELDKNYLSLEKDIITKMAGKKMIYLYQLNQENHFWCPIKTIQDVIKANKLYLTHYEQQPAIYGVFGFYEQRPNQVLVHKSSRIGQNVSLGPNVVIGAGCTIGNGVRIQNSIIQAGAEIKRFTLISSSIVGFHSIIGNWCRIEGTQNLNERSSNERITVLGVGVQVDNEICVRNSIALPNKKIKKDCEGEHIL